METQRILVTGGSGFIGTNLVNELRSRGHEVLAVDLLHHEGEADLYSDSYSDYVRGDVRNYRQMERIFDDNDKFDYVYHLAAEYGRWNGEGYYENLWETNVIGLKNMIRLQEKLGFRMISFSSAEVYGDYEGIMTEYVMENRPIKDTYQMNDYAISKWAGELMCMNSATMFGTETVRVRPVNCYGPHEAYSPYKGFIPIFIYKALHGLPYSVHKGHKRIIDYVEDTANTFANIVDNFNDYMDSFNDDVKLVFKSFEFETMIEFLAANDMLFDFIKELKQSNIEEWFSQNFDICPQFGYRTADGNMKY